MARVGSDIYKNISFLRRRIRQDDLRPPIRNHICDLLHDFIRHLLFCALIDSTDRLAHWQTESINEVTQFLFSHL